MGPKWRPDAQKETTKAAPTQQRLKNMKKDRSGPPQRGTFSIKSRKKPKKTQSEKTSKKQQPKNIQIRCRKAMKTECKPMPKTWPKKAVERYGEKHAKHDFLGCENTQIYCKGHRIWRFWTSRPRKEKALKKHEKQDPQTYSNQWKFLTKSMMKKVMAKQGKLYQKKNAKW